MRLLTNLFQASARDEKLTHAQALQLSMLAILDNAQSDDDAHPRRWAPFIIIGEPAPDDSDICYKDSGEAAISNCSRVITSGRYLGRKLAGLYSNRGLELQKTGQFDRALADYNEAIRLDPKYDSAINRRCYLRSIIGQLQLALADCNVALRLSPENAASLETRGITFLKLGYLEQSIADFNAALRINPNLAESLYGRGLAKQKKGDSIGGDADVAAAKALTADIAEQFAKLGIQPTARANVMPGYGGVRRNDESLAEDRHGVVH
jgi:tetratricopeptide (TPR) repeat protein